MTTTDAALWEAIRRDDAAAFTALYERYWRRLFTTAFARLPDREACEEIVHDIFLTLSTERARLQIAALLGLDFEGRLASALNQLPQRCREIFLLSRIQHCSNEEIAERLHISRRSVENQLTTALRHLRLTLKGLGVVWLVTHLG